MRTNIEIDDQLLGQAMELSPRTTKKAVVEEALVLVVKLHRQQALRKLRGMGWEGDLSAMRQSRFPGESESDRQQPEDLRLPAA